MIPHKIENYSQLAPQKLHFRWANRSFKHFFFVCLLFHEKKKIKDDREWWMHLMGMCRTRDHSNANFSVNHDFYSNETLINLSNAFRIFFLLLNASRTQLFMCAWVLIAWEAQPMISMWAHHNRMQWWMMLLRWQGRKSKIIKIAEILSFKPINAVRMSPSIHPNYHIAVSIHTTNKQKKIKWRRKKLTFNYLVMIFIHYYKQKSKK